MSAPHPSESYVLGTLLNFGEGIELCDKLDTRHFADPRHQRIWHAMRELFEDGKPYTTDCVHAVLHRDGVLEEIGGAAFLFETMESGVSPSTLHVHTGDLVNLMLVRQVGLVADRIANEATDDANAGNLIELADREFTTLQMQRESRHEASSKSVAIGALRALEERAKTGGIVGYSTGLDELDAATNGLQNGALIILAARPAMGKTSLAMNIAASVATKQKHPVTVFSLEMSAQELGARLLSAESRVNTGAPKNFTQADWTRLAIATGNIADAPITVVDASLLTAHELRSHARKLYAQGKLRVLVVDYLQLMTGDAESREREIGEISRALKMIAKELSIPVLALSQLNRGVENRQEKRPTLADLRDSGSIEQDADTVWFIYRDEVYNKDTQDKGIAEVIIAKNRNGGVGNVRLRFSPEIQRFDNLDWRAR